MEKFSIFNFINFLFMNIIFLNYRYNFYYDKDKAKDDRYLTIIN
jgi:hypothetical protein